MAAEVSVSPKMDEFWILLSMLRVKCALVKVKLHKACSVVFLQYLQYFMKYM